MKIVDLPDDVLSIIFLLLDPPSFIALCRSCKLLHTNYLKDPLFWRTKTSSTFRTPISPLLKADGARWYSLYRRLKTQTRLYTWGQGVKGNLGHGLEITRGPPRDGVRRVGGRIIHHPPRLVFQRTTSTWPTEAHVPEEIGVIADLQCGGWSTVILSSEGKLYATGSINSENSINVGIPTDNFEKLKFPSQSSSAVWQFSAGRSHILALTDDHEILTWDRINARGIKVRSRMGSRFGGNPVRVVGGWGESSAYIPELGIVYWKPLKNDQQDNSTDTKEAIERIIPDTARRSLGDGSVFEVLAHVVLEGIIVWITSDSKIWACDIRHYNDEDTAPNAGAIQLPGFGDYGDQLKDLQGSFRHFAAFTSSGRVLAGNNDYVRRCFEMAQLAEANDLEGRDMADPSNWGNLEDLLMHRPRDVPALQNSGVISLRFGDWHYQALHSNGKITSHGHEPESCGALGLGNPYEGGMLRGETTGLLGLRQDTKLRPVADLRGREVWFEPEKRNWLQHLQYYVKEMIRKNPDQRYWHDLLYDPVKQTIFSEWIEQEGRHWEDGPVTSSQDLSKAANKMNLRDSEDFHLDSYFALAIGAAGWHSGALVLLDEEKAEEVRGKWIHNPKPIAKEAQDKNSQENVLNMPMPGTFHHGESSNKEEKQKPIWEEESFPRIQFSDGSESPHPPGLGEGEHTLGSALRIWRDGMPSMQDLGLEPI